jgi:hypothetical protein
MERIGFRIGAAIEFPAHSMVVRGALMRFAKIVFWIAAIWGVLVLTPLYFMLI